MTVKRRKPGSLKNWTFEKLDDRRRHCHFRLLWSCLAAEFNKENKRGFLLLVVEMLFKRIWR